MTDEAEALLQFYHDESLDRLGDREWRLNNLYHIIDATGNRLLFRPNDIQEQLNHNLWYLNLILKSRQHGITTDICILYLDFCLFTPNIRAGIIAHTRDDAEIFFNDKIKYAYDNGPGRFPQRP